jgi:hypothetical protein
MFNHLLTSVREQIEHISYTQSEIDPVSTLLKNISSNANWQVELQNDESQLSKIPELKKHSIEFNFNKELKKENKTFNIGALVSNKRSPNFPTQTQKIILQKLKNIPIYTVVNNFNEVVVSSPRSEEQKDTLTYLRDLYNELFFWSHDTGSISILLFFMNEQDAGSYLHEICKKDPKEAEKLGLTVKEISLDTFYKFNRTSPPKIQARLIGDLKEIKSVISRLHNSYDLTINPKQRYSEQWFQGIPIYKLKPSKDNKTNSLINYSINSNTEHKYIFFSRKDAELAWKTFLSREKEIYANNKPNIEVYNFENLMLDLEKNHFENVSKTILVPPYKKWRESTLDNIAKINIEYSNQTRFMYSMKLKFEDIRRIYKGLLWLVTSDTLPGEDNSW